jgi:enoyl-CoA hydratase/carnithine racemase
MGQEVVAAFRAAREDTSVRAVILCGAGKGFCAGVDLDALKANLAGGDGKGPKLGEEEFVRSFPLELLAYPKPVIAAINGAAIGVGVTMILPCDIRIASERAKLGVPFTKLESCLGSAAPTSCRESSASPRAGARAHRA